MLDRRAFFGGLVGGLVGGTAMAGTAVGRSISGQVQAAMQRFKDGWRGLLATPALMRDLNETMSKLAVDRKITGFTAELKFMVRVDRKTQHELRVRFRTRGSDVNHAYKLIL